MIRRLAVAALCLGAATSSSCTATGQQGPQETTSSTSAPSASRTSARASASTTTAPKRLERAIQRVATKHPDADLAVALAPVGTTGTVRVVGDPPTLVAWSTIKVPLSLAAVRSGGAPASTRDIDQALTASDNEAAARLWERLGSGQRASDAVEAQLRRGGDGTTAVPAQVTSPGYSPFGQARWRLTDQVRFTAALPCLAGSSRVTDDMGRVVQGQRWGLGRIRGASIKGGWGSTPRGYVVRQLGIVPGTKGASAVTLQVRTGTHEQGTAIADELAEALREHRAELPVGTC